VKTNETFWCSECSAQLMLHFMNSKVVEKLKRKAKEDLVLINQRRTHMRYDASQYPVYIIEAWAWRLQIHYSLSCTQSNANLEQLYATLSSNILMYMKKLLLMDIAEKIIWKAYDKPINSCVHSYRMNLDECMMNINILMKNTTTFWCSSWRT